MNDIQKLKNSINSQWSEDPAPLHDFYREHFNLIDLADRYWYSIRDSHHNIHWESQLFFGTLCFAIINCWSLKIQTHFEEWKVFRINMAKDLLTYGLE